jgi:hypothetical protein
LIEKYPSAEHLLIAVCEKFVNDLNGGILNYIDENGEKDKYLSLLATEDGKQQFVELYKAGGWDQWGFCSTFLLLLSRLLQINLHAYNAIHHEPPQKIHDDLTASIFSGPAVHLIVWNSTVSHWDLLVPQVAI